MQNFTSIATPHQDILDGKLTMDIFAADLWQVVKNNAPEEYVNSDVFFEKTYLTKGLKNILDIARKRLDGKSGDSIIQLQTPFGGGKTHSLIALYHRAREWNVNVVVLDGTALDPKDIKLWEELEKQLTGKTYLTRGDNSPGRDKLTQIIKDRAPVLILIDELLGYVTKAAAIEVGESTLASQIFAFMQELTGTISSIGNSLLVFTLPSSVLEHYDENAEKMFQRLQKITGRTEKIYTPVEEDEIEHVIRTRLFSYIDEKRSKRIVNNFVEHAKKERLLIGDEVFEYKRRFLNSYPFKPEVIDVLYKRWGSFPTFQRTRGTLRLLSLVVYNLIDKKIPYIRLGDFDLKSDEIKRELIKHVGNEWDSILSQDITGENSGAKKVDAEIQPAYRPYKLGTSVATTIFMQSFSGGDIKELTTKEIKLANIYPKLSSSIVDTIITELKEKLFYLSDEKLIFTNQPNLNRIIISREENINKIDIERESLKLLKKHISSNPILKIYFYPQFPKDVPDNEEFKLIILDKEKIEKDFFEKYGENLRVYRNTMFFLTADKSYEESFFNYLRRYIALTSIDGKQLKLSELQKKELKNKINNHEQRSYEELRKLYRKLYIPASGTLKQNDLGLPTVGENFIDKEIYSYLKNKGYLLENIAPKVIKEKYLQDNEYLEIKKLYLSLLRTPGEIRVISKENFIKSIISGVEQGLFGFGYVKQGDIKNKTFKQRPEVNFSDEEAIINPALIKEEKQKEITSSKKVYSEDEFEPKTKYKDVAETLEKYTPRKYSNLSLRLKVPAGRLSTIVQIVNFFQRQFNTQEIEVLVNVKDGSINITDYEDKIKEALIQSGITIEKEELGDL